MAWEWRKQPLSSNLHAVSDRKKSLWFVVKASDREKSSWFVVKSAQVSADCECRRRRRLRPARADTLCSLRR